MRDYFDAKLNSVKSYVKLNVSYREQTSLETLSFKTEEGKEGPSWELALTLKRGDTSHLEELLDKLFYGP